MPVPTDLSKLSTVVKNDVVKKATYNQLVAKVDNIDTNDFVLKTKYDTDKAELEKKIPNTGNLATKTALTTVENKIPDTSNFAIKSALTTVENKIPDISNLATKTLVNKVDNRIPNISNYAAKAALATVWDKISNISNLVEKSDYNTKITCIESNVNKLQAYDLSYFRGNQYFDEGDGKQNYLVFLPMRKHFQLNTVVGVIDRVLSWESKGMSNESIKPLTTSNNILNPRLSYYGSKIRVQFTSCLRQAKFCIYS